MTVTPFGQRRRHHHVGRAEHGRAGAAAQKHGGAAQVLGRGVNVAALDFDFGAQRLETFQVQIDGPRADDAAAGQRHPRLFQPPQQRPHDADRAAHFADEIVIRVAADFLRVDGQRAALETSPARRAIRGFAP